ncbi:MAG: hypothetical protein RXP98_05860 [Thermoplasmata archaeon]
MIFSIKNGRISFKNRSIRNNLLNEGYNVMGKRDFYLDPIEAIFLMKEKGAKIVSDGKEMNPEDIENIFNVDKRYYAVYSDLRKRGYKINNLLYLEREGLNVYIFSPRDAVVPEELRDSIVAIVDDDLDCTYFKIKMEDIYGKFDGYDDYFIGGKGEFSDEYKKELHDDLVRRGCRVKSGLKFGTEFIAYTNREDVHSRYMVKIIRNGMEWIEVAGLSRVANGVKKTLLLATKNQNFKYYSVTWFRP